MDDIMPLWMDVDIRFASWMSDRLWIGYLHSVLVFSVTNSMCLAK